MSIWSTTRRFSGSASVNARAVGNGTSAPPRPGARSADGDLPPAQHHLTGGMTGAIGLPLGLMCIPGPAHSGPIFFQHGLEHLQARRHDQLLELGLRINEDIDQRKVPWRRGYRLATARDCARLLLHGGSLLGGFHLGFVTGRIARPVKSRRLQISTARGTSPPSLSECQEAVRALIRVRGWDNADYICGLNCRPWEENTEITRCEVKAR